MGQALLASADGQDADHRRDRRGAARRGDRDGVRQARAALHRLHGQRDVRRQRLNVVAHEAAGRRGAPGRLTGSRTLKDATNEAMRDWMASVEDTHYILGSSSARTPSRASCETSSPSSARNEASVRRKRSTVGCPTSSSRAWAAGRTRRGCSTRSSRTRAPHRRRGGRQQGRARASTPAPLTYGAARRAARLDELRAADRRRSDDATCTPARRASTTRASAPSTASGRTAGRVEYTSVDDKQALEAFHDGSPSARGSSPRWRPRTRSTRR